MVKNMNEFPLSVFRRIMKSRINTQITADSVYEMRDAVESWGSMIAERAVEIAESDGRITVKRDDVLQAVREFKS